MKILLVHANNPSNWLSCQMIRDNIVKMYSLLPNTFEVRHAALAAEAEATRFGRLRHLQNFVRICLDWQPDKIAFVDNLPHPLEALTALRFASCHLPELIFHVYGNFTWEAKNWFELGELTKGTRARFFAASPRQKKLVESFLLPQENPRAPSPVEVLPFAVDNQRFIWDAKLRQLGRTQLGLSDDTKMIFYSGRLSLQKGVDRLIQLVVRAATLSRAPLCLVVAGTYDDRGAPLLGLPMTLGCAFKKMDLATKDRAVGKLFKFVGSINNGDLSALYCAADAVASIGFHHDEDFGMAIAEAGMCGAPLLLSNWGGFASFNVSTQCQLVNSKLTPGGLEFSNFDALTKLVRLLSPIFSPAARQEQAGLFAAKFSVPQVAARLHTLLSPPQAHSQIATTGIEPNTPLFNGFSDHLFQFSQSFREDSPNFSALIATGALYERVYRHYLEAVHAH